MTRGFEDAGYKPGQLMPTPTEYFYTGAASFVVVGGAWNTLAGLTFTITAAENGWLYIPYKVTYAHDVGGHTSVSLNHLGVGNIDLTADGIAAANYVTAKGFAEFQVVKGTAYTFNITLYFAINGTAVIAGGLHSKLAYLFFAAP